MENFYSAFQNPEIFYDIYRFSNKEKYEDIKGKPWGKGLACAMLSAMLQLKQKKLFLPDNFLIKLDAAGDKPGDPGLHDQRPLTKYYERLGFRAKPQYLINYGLALQEFDEKGTPRDDLIKKYHADIRAIPMIGTLGNVVKMLDLNCARKIPPQSIILK